MTHPARRPCRRRDGSRCARTCRGSATQCEPAAVLAFAAQRWVAGWQWRLTAPPPPPPPAAPAPRCAAAPQTSVTRRATRTQPTEKKRTQKFVIKKKQQKKLHQ